MILKIIQVRRHNAINIRKVRNNRATKRIDTTMKIMQKFLITLAGQINWDILRKVILSVFFAIQWVGSAVLDLIFYK